MNQAKSEKIGHAIELDENKKKLKIVREVEAEAKKVSKLRDKSLDTISQIDKKESVFIGIRQKQEIFSNQTLFLNLALLMYYMTALNYLIKQ